MPIIYTYPTKATPVGADLLLMSDSVDNKTKQATISSIKDTINVVDSLSAGSGISLTGSSLPTGDITIANTGVLSISSANTALTASGSGAITLTSTAYGGGATIGHVPTGGSANTFLKGNGSFSTVNVATDVTGIIAVGNGGLGTNSFTTGDILYASGGSIAKLSIGTAGQVLKVNSGATAPEWGTDSDSGPGTGTQYKLPMWATTTTLGDSIVAQAPSTAKITISGDVDVEKSGAAVNFDVKTTNAPGFGIRINSGIYSGTSPSIGPIGTTGGGAILQFGTQTSGQQFDFKNNKIVFDSDSTNTFIQADTATPENLEVHADQDIKLLADNYVAIQSAGAIPANSSATGVRGSITYDTQYLYICIGTNTWRRAEIGAF